MRRILLVLTVAVVMAAMMLAMAMPVFAAKPSSFSVNCFNGSVGAGSQSSTGRSFGHGNKFVATQYDFRGYECERTIQ
jgi:hypothetical protein